jgi:hypothetical protein
MQDFDQARQFVRSLGLKSVSEWNAYCKGVLKHLPPKPSTIPSAQLQYTKIRVGRAFKIGWAIVKLSYFRAFVFRYTSAFISSDFVLFDSSKRL